MVDPNGNGAIPIVQVIKAMIDSGELTPENLEKAIEVALERVRVRAFPTLKMTPFLDHHQARGIVDRLRRAARTVKKNGCPAFCHELATLSLRIPVQLDDFCERIPVPWNTFPVGKRIVIILGMRPFKLPQGAAERLAIDQHDHMAYEFLEACFTNLRIGCRVESLTIPRDVTVAEAINTIQTLERDQTIGGLITIGSAVSNVATVPMSRMILPLGSTTPPAQLHWAHKMKNPPLVDDPLSCNTTGTRGMSVGQGNGAEFFARSDDHDAGMVLVRRKTIGKRKLVQAAIVGHGGMGTYAASRGLMRPFDVAERMNTISAWDVEEDYAFMPIAVEMNVGRKKETRWRFLSPDANAGEYWYTIDT